MARIIFYAIASYLLYKLVFDVILPVRKTTKAMRNQFREAQERMNDAYRQQQPGNTPKPEKQDKTGDSIDFEEIR